MVLENKYTGETPIIIEGKEYCLLYNMRAMAALRTNLGEVNVTQALQQLDIEKIAIILECGLKKHHPEITIEKLMDMFIPASVAIKAISKALRYAIDGGLEPEQPIDTDKNSPPA